MNAAGAGNAADGEPVIVALPPQARLRLDAIALSFVVQGGAKLGQ